MTKQPLRQQLGCWLNERWRTELVLRAPRLTKRLGLQWLDLCNRKERLATVPGGGRECLWKGSSRLTVCRVFPRLGARLLQHLVQQWPIRFTVPPRAPNNRPQVSIIIAIRGLDRLPLLRRCLATLFAQEGCSWEILIVEQDWDRLIEPHLPSAVRYAHARSLTPESAFNRSWALNLGARLARGSTLVFHDGDMLAPTRFVETACSLLRNGFDAVRPVRLIACLDRMATEDICAGAGLDAVSTLSEMLQNCAASLAVRSEAYWHIGGHDEEFCGWGGEDDEIFQRLATLSLCPGRYMPLVHLWHPPQLEKIRRKRSNPRFELKSREPIETRIGRLRGLNLGSPAAPAIGT